MAITPSYIATKEAFDAASGLSIDERALLLSPQGNRIHVMLNPPPEEYGGIILPQGYTDESASGWIFSVGPLAGTTAIPHPCGPICDDPGDLLCQAIVFGRHTGKVLAVDFLDRAIKSGYLVMTDRDIWTIDHSRTE